MRCNLTNLAWPSAATTLRTELLHAFPAPSRRRAARHSAACSSTKPAARPEATSRRLRLPRHQHDDSGHGKYQREHADQEHDLVRMARALLISSVSIQIADPLKNKQEPAGAW
jgi:hypothetical protein